MKELLALASVEELRIWAVENGSDAARRGLIAEFERLLEYRNAEEWNRLVRVCEALALVGWGDVAPVEAIADRWINGAMYTKLMAADFSDQGEQRWIVRDGLQVMEAAELHAGGGLERLDSQRIRLPKNPVRLVRSGNLQLEARPFGEQAKRLRSILDRDLAHDYGPGFGYLGVTLNFSYADAGLGLASEYFHDEADVIERDGVSSFVRPRLDVGRVASRKGETVLMFTRHYTSAEGALPLAVQCAGLAEDLGEILEIAATKLRRKAPEYEFDRLRADVDRVLAEWLGGGGA